MAIKVGFLGVGQAGSNICEIAELYGYRTVIMNTSPEDLDSIQLVKNKFLIGSNGGAGKDRRVAKADVKSNFKQIAAFVADKFKEDDIELIYVVFSSGGGTGSGMGPMVIDVLGKLVPEKKFGAIAILPGRQESAVAQVNSIECLRELLGLNVPTMIVDNEKYLQKYPVAARKSLYDAVNSEVVDNFNLVLNGKRQVSKYGNLDTKDLMKLLSTPGATVISRAAVGSDVSPDGITLQKRIIQSWDDSVYAQIEYDGVVKRMGFFYELSDSLTKMVGYDEIHREIGQPLEVFEGFYKADADAVVSILTGLSFPEDRMRAVAEQLEKSRDSLAAKREYGVLSNADTSWFSEIREETVPKPKVKAAEGDLASLFDKYDS